MLGHARCWLCDRLQPGTNCWDGIQIWQQGYQLLGWEHMGDTKGRKLEGGPKGWSMISTKLVGRENFDVNIA